MKKLILGTLVACTSAMGYSQMRTIEHESTVDVEARNAQLSIQTTAPRAASTPGTSAPGATIFEETFGNGLSGDGTNGAWTASGSPSTALWVYRGMSTVPDLTVGSQGAFATGTGPITSATASNGFMIFDSDYLDNNGVSTNIGFGTSPAPHTGYLESPTLDLSSYPNILIEVASYYRKFNSQCFIEFSIDGGATWPYSILLYGDNTALNDIAVNNSTATNDVTATYVPAGVGGNSNVKFRFTFDGTDVLGNPNGSGYYYWQVDDIKIIEAPHNDLSVSQIYFDYSTTAAFDTTLRGHYYAEMPVRQANFDTLNFGAVFTNFGSVAQPNTRAAVRITSPTGSSTVTSPTPIPSLAVNATDSTYAGQYITNQGMGEYTFDFHAVSDSTEDVPQNDTTSYSLDVTQRVYSWATTANIGYRPQNTTSSYEICQLFDIFEADTATSIAIDFNYNANDPNDPDNLVPGTDFLTARIIDANGFDNNNAYIGTNIAEYNNGTSTFYSVTAADLGNVITLPMTHAAGTPTLTPGSYYGCVKTFNPNVFTSSDDQRSNDAWVAGSTILDLDDENDWGGFTVTTTMQIGFRSGVDPCAGVTITATTNGDESAQIGSISAAATGGTPVYTYNWVYPDGTTTNTGDTINGLTQTGTYTLVVTDALGCQSAQITQNLGGCVGLADIVATGDTTSVTSGNDGAIDLTVTGGSGNYIFNWSNGAGTEDISGLAPGTYTVTITDPTCAALTQSFSFTVACVGLTAVNAVGNITEESGAGASDGAIDIDITGGSGNLSFLWSNGATTEDITGLSAGTYTVTISDLACAGTTYTFDFTIVIVSVEEVSFATDIKLYPNPNNGQFNLELNNLTENITVSIKNVIGQTIFTENVSAGSVNKEISLGNAQSGVYFIDMKSESGEIATYKMVIE